MKKILQNLLLSRQFCVSFQTKKKFKPKKYCKNLKCVSKLKLFLDVAPSKQVEKLSDGKQLHFLMKNC